MDPLTGPARSWLFVPATRRERFEKAARSGADRVILDLEDAVAPAEKVAAREALRGAALPAGPPVYLRVNGFGTEWFEGDLAVAAALPLAGLLLPKTDSAEAVARAAAALPAGQRVVPIVETAAGLWNAEPVARHPRVERLAFGALDFQLDTGMHDEGETFAWVRARIAVASRVAGVAPPVDSVPLSIDDEPGILADAVRGRRFGFAGKLCIHPRQLAPIHQGFHPADAEVAWAEGLLSEWAARPVAERAVFSYRGTLVDRPVLERARSILAQAGKAPPGP
ncbi:MAG: CoA ester lyase [Deltaproteobacteria bacterium]|nr:CoA ester lyase [Deltaproteobacteria bacterium]